MIRAIKLLILCVLLVAIIIVSVANRGPITLKLLPPQLESILPLSIELPVFVVLIGCILVGMLLGYIVEYLREHKHRRTASQKRREAERLVQENEVLRKKTMTEDDEVLALLD